MFGDGFPLLQTSPCDSLYNITQVFVALITTYCCINCAVMEFFFYSPLISSGKPISECWFLVTFKCIGTHDTSIWTKIFEMFHEISKANTWACIRICHEYPSPRNMGPMHIFLRINLLADWL